LAVVPRIAERITVMKSGTIVETGSVSDIFERAREPYTQNLIASLPRLPGQSGALGR
ncbi:MAG: ABC transporter ATP-binding protein, partial [Microbacteriaceae bacterium]|nr:ABC transporter ATP-binding protein [Microbacteriaceae bacterium]